MTVLNNLVSYVKFSVSSGDWCNDFLAGDRLPYELGKALYKLANCGSNWQELYPVLTLIAIAICYNIYAWRK